MAPATRPLAPAVSRPPRLFLFALAFALITFPGSVAAATLAAWVELVGPGRDATIRVITDEASCPDLSADGGPLHMQVRADPGPLVTGGVQVPPADFPVRVCEVTAPPGKPTILLEGRTLPAPPTDIKRVVVFGDTGCRIKKRKIQDCNDSQAWPYAKLAAHAAEAKPDLVIHVGDYLYRERPCSPDAGDCPTSPTGYGWSAWDADFFTPSAPLLAAAPWIMVRGNHEACSRAGEGWVRFLDHAPVDNSCAQVVDFFVVALGKLGFVVMDSAQVADASGAEAEDSDDEEDTGETTDLADTLRRKYEDIAHSVPANAWLLSHAPFNAVRVGKKARNDTDDKALRQEGTVDNTLQQQAIGGLLPPGIKMIVSGHIHLFEALSFGGRIPPQLVVGTGGDKLGKKPKVPAEIAGVPVTASIVLKHFGYMVWDRDDRDGQKWKGELRNEDGAPMVRCQLAERELSCAAEP